MAVATGKSLINIASGFGHLPIARQVGMFVGLALSVALSVAVVLWSQEPNYRPLSDELNLQDVNEISDVLQKSDIPFKLDERSGTLLVPNNKLYKARMALAVDGLPKNASKGFLQLEKSHKFGTSQFMEAARYLHALEGELENTINSFDNVKQSRVHIALPRQSSFVRDFRKPSASVLIDVYKSNVLKEGQVSAIVHLVASSVPELDKDNVTVVDQTGHLLTDKQGSDVMSLADKQLKYIRQLEDEYMRKIEDLLLPMLGPGKIRVRVAADLDFTERELTKEAFDGEKPALRSEQSMMEQAPNPNAQGVPGALANQPQPPNPNPNPNGDANADDNLSKRNQMTKNYELNKTISHTRKQIGHIKRLSVAILADDNIKTDKAGKTTRIALTREELEQIKNLAQNAIGFDQKRGDTVSVINRSFVSPPTMEAAKPLPIWERPWFFDALKQSIGGLFVLYVVFGILRPTLRTLAGRGVAVSDLIQSNETDTPENKKELRAGLLANELAASDEQMRLIKEMATSDPKRVAQVVKRWVDSD